MRYEPAAANPTATHCQTGTKALQRAIKDVYDELGGDPGVYGCFNRRKARSASSWSLHAEGRALDVGVPARYHDLGWELSCELVENRVLYGIQRVIWDGHIWTITKPGEWKRLTVPISQQHLDHIHLEQYWSSALKPRSVESSYAHLLEENRAQHEPS